MSDGLRCSGIPLGGLGTGSVELRADGYFHEWQIMNNAPWGAGPSVDLPLDTAYFGIQAADTSAVLGTVPPYNAHLNDPYGLPWLCHAETIDAEARMPFTELRYRVAPLPVDVSLEAFSPFIPLDARNSALPLAFFTFSVWNRSATPVRVALFMAQRNIVGYCEPDNPPVLSYEAHGIRPRIVFTRKALPDGCSSGGSLVIGCRADGEADCSYVLGPRSQRDIWEPLRRQGCLEGECWTDAPGWKTDRHIPLGVLAAGFTLAPRQRQRVTFALAWHFPNMWERPYAPKECTAGLIGHRYSEWFSSAAEVFDYGIANQQVLRSRSWRFRNDFYRSSQPRWLLDAVNAQLTTLVKSSWWDQQGRFGIWEGLGCCGLQTTDITHYGSFPLLQFFPELQKSQMRLTAANFEGPGGVPHLMPGNFSCSDRDPKQRIDLAPQFVLLVWRDSFWTGDMDYAREMWPKVRAAIEHARSFDTDGDGLPNNRGPDQTYDQFPLKGTSAFVGLLFGAALRAAAELARALGEQQTAALLDAEHREAMRQLDDQLWNGTYYRLSYDPCSGEANEGVMADQVNADWFMRQTTGEGLLPNGRVRSALGAVIEHCSRDGFLANCAWPADGATEIRRSTANQADWPWSGVEYAVAAHLTLLELKDQALTVARNVWDRHEQMGLRFNHIECGSHYYRALSAWALYLALSGFSMNALSGEVGVAAGAQQVACVVCTPGGRAFAEWEADRATLTMTGRCGRLEFVRLMIKRLRARQASAALNGAEVQCETRQLANGVRLEFQRSVVLARGDVLTVKTGH